MDEKYIEAVEWLKEKVRTVDTMLEQDWSQRPETIAKVSKKSEMYQSISQWTGNLGVLSKGHKNLPQGLVSHEPTFLFLTNLNLMNYGHITKSI